MTIRPARSRLRRHLGLVSSTTSSTATLTETTLSLPGLCPGLFLARLSSRLRSGLYLALRSLWSLRAQQGTEP